jgi:hypothetical protein
VPKHFIIRPGKLNTARLEPSTPFRRVWFGHEAEARLKFPQLHWTSEEFGTLQLDIEVSDNTSGFRGGINHNSQSGSHRLRSTTDSSGSDDIAPV